MVLTVLISFLVGVVGALVMVYLRWVGVAPRFKSSLEIDKLEEEYETIRQSLADKLKRKEPLTEPDVKHSNDLRDDLWRQRSTSFLGWACLYVLLGGAVAALFGGEIKDLTDVATVAKVASTGMFWTSFLSLFDAKLADRAAQDLRNKMDEEYEEAVTKVRDEAEKSLKAKHTELLVLAEKHNKLVRKYNTLLKRPASSP